MEKLKDFTDEKIEFKEFKTLIGGSTLCERWDECTYVLHNVSGKDFCVTTSDDEGNEIDFRFEDSY